MTMPLLNTKPAITDSQRKCLSHVLRNTETGFSYMISAIENPQMTPTCKELLSIVRALQIKLKKIESALSNDSFCILQPNECEFIADYVGCKKPD